MQLVLEIPLFVSRSDLLKLVAYTWSKPLVNDVVCESATSIGLGELGFMFV